MIPVDVSFIPAEELFILVVDIRLILAEELIILADFQFIIYDVGSWLMVMSNIISVSDSNSCFDWKLNKVVTDWDVVGICIRNLYML